MLWLGIFCVCLFLVDEGIVCLDNVFVVFLFIGLDWDVFFNFLLDWVVVLLFWEGFSFDVVVCFGWVKNVIVVINVEKIFILNFLILNFCFLNRFIKLVF